MIIRCPGCQKRYDISQYVIAQKKQYKLRCSNCHTLWQLSNELSAEPQAKRAPLPTNAPKKRRPTPKTYSAWHDLIKRYSLDLITILVAVAVIVLLIIYEGQHIRDFYNKFHLESTSTVVAPKTGPQEIELQIENVAFSTIEYGGHLRFMVKGEIVNQSSMTLASPDLRVIVRGACTDDPNDISQRCAIAQWVHPMFGALIAAGERQFFQTFAPNPGSIKAKEVEIAGIASTKEGS